MIDALRTRGLLSSAAAPDGLLGYRFAGALQDAFELLDRRLVEVMGEGLALTPHSCTTLIPRDVLDRIGFFDKLPCLPFHAVPHAAHGSDGAEAADGLLLSPSTCYSTFAHLEGTGETWELRPLTARGRCHRAEATSAEEPTRMRGFDMREVVLIGDADLVPERSEEIFARALRFVEALGGDLEVERASDVFYGERSGATRRVQYALGVKKEVRLPWTDGRRVAVGSRNLHRDLFTRTFAIGPPAPAPAMHSACVAFGIDRLLLTLLAATPGHDVEVLTERIATATVVAEGAGT